ncbi:polyprenyl synthetase family protein [Alloscardovia venturai]|uniref:Polyprenyl synthetase family protein n=1 Tax=Alloscardovia venturai TaxID=1769421 RepID=A0ABW2Y3T8_9BIFI
MTLSRETVEHRLEEIIRQAWHTHALYFSHTPRSSVEEVLNLVKEQAVSSNQGGKRLRALTLMQTAYTFCPEEVRIDDSALLDLACAIEIFQTAALIHDDIMDDADTRRGAPSAHKALAVQTSASQGQGLALMLGDLLATLSIRVAFTASHKLSNSDEIFRTFLAMHDQVEIGQIMDVSMETIELTDTDAIESSIWATYINKTASYTTIAPLLIGILASSHPQISQNAQSFAQSVGNDLGVAFQIHDDLIDILSDSQTTGKPVGGDIREGKRTLLLARALQLASPHDRDTLLVKFEHTAHRDKEDVEIIRTIFHRSGAIDSLIDEVDKLWQRAAHAVLTTCMMHDISPEKTQALITMCSHFIN